MNLFILPTSRTSAFNPFAERYLSKHVAGQTLMWGDSWVKQGFKRTSPQARHRPWQNQTIVGRSAQRSADCLPRTQDQLDRVAICRSIAIAIPVDRLGQECEYLLSGCEIGCRRRNFNGEPDRKHDHADRPASRSAVFHQRKGRFSEADRVRRQPGIHPPRR
jgi:hypothetical protein